MKKSRAPTLDLHGFKTEDVFDAVESFLRQHESHAHEVRIMHGKGTGKVKAKVIEYLRLARYPHRPEAANDGVLIVSME